MLVLLDRNEILEMLESGVALMEKRRPAIPVLANTKITANKEENKVQFYFTDMDMAFSCEADATVESSGSITIPAQMFYSICKKSEKDSQFELFFNEESGYVEFKTSNSFFKLPAIDASEYPDFEYKNELVAISVSAEVLQELLSKTKHAVSEDETRFYLGGIYLHPIEKDGNGFLRAVATDCYRLALADANITSSCSDVPGIILPTKAAAQLLRMLEGYVGPVEIGISRNRIRFELAGRKLLSKIIDAKYPDYQKVIPMNQDKHLIVNREKLLRAIDLVSSVSEEKTKMVIIKIEGSKMIINASGQIGTSASGQRVIDVDYDNPQDVILTFNLKYLTDSLQSIKEEEVELKFVDEKGGMIAQSPENENYMSLLMPVKG